MVKCDFNQDKRAWLDKWDPIAAVMGIKRTNDADDAITDMAVMNMGDDGFRGYSFDDYEGLLEQKKTEINEFVDSFIPVLCEYRDNYNGKGSASGKARAQYAHDLLNQFYDGGSMGCMPCANVALSFTVLARDPYYSIIVAIHAVIIKIKFIICLMHRNTC